MRGGSRPAAPTRRPVHRRAGRAERARGHVRHLRLGGQPELCLGRFAGPGTADDQRAVRPGRPGRLDGGRTRDQLAIVGLVSTPQRAAAGQLWCRADPVVGVEGGDGRAGVHEPARAQPAELRGAGQQVEQRDVVRGGTGLRLRHLARAAREQQAAAIRAGDVESASQPLDVEGGGRGRPRSRHERPARNDVEPAINEHAARCPAQPGRARTHAGRAAAAVFRPAAGAAGADHERVHWPA